MYMATSNESSQTQERDANGRFIKKGVDPVQTIATKISSQTPADKIKEEPDAFLEKPLVSFSINNPFKRFLYWLKDIRKKQTTTFDFKISIPLIALPIFLIVLGAAFQFFFTLGKQTSNENPSIILSPTPTAVVTINPKAIIISRFGVIKATYQVQNLLSIENSNDSTSSSKPEPSQKPPSHYVLLEKNDKITFITAPLTMPLSNYLNLRVIATGKYDEEKSTLIIENPQDIELVQ